MFRTLTIPLYKLEIYNGKDHHICHCNPNFQKKGPRYDWVAVRNDNVPKGDATDFDIYQVNKYQIYLYLR